MTAMVDHYWPFIVLCLAGFLPNELWRWIGILCGGILDEDGEIAVWVKATAIGLLGAVIARLVLTPVGTLASVPFTVRLAAMIVGFAAFLLLRRSVLVGVIVGELALMIGTFSTVP